LTSIETLTRASTLSQQAHIDYGCGVVVTPAVPPTLPGTALSGRCNPRVPGGRNEHTSLQLLPTLPTEFTWIDAGADAVLGVNIPFNTTVCPASASAETFPASFAHTVGVLITSVVGTSGAFCTQPE
jgi:hypothetical protein